MTYATFWFLGGGAVVACAVAFGLAVSGVIASDVWRDFVGWLSLFITTLGLGYTIYQVTLIEAATRAAREAADRTREDIRHQLSLFTAASIHRLINEASTFLERKEWGKAVLRLHDLADQAAQISEASEEWAALVRGLRDAAVACAALESERRNRATHEKWTRLLTDLRTRLDDHFRPM
jgi:hypothetical protein